MKKDGFALRRGQNNDGTSSHFTAGAGRGRYANTRRQTAPVVFKFEIIQFEVGFLEQQPDRLADIKRAAATEGDDTVALVAAKRCCAFDDVPFDRVRIDAREHEPIP